MTTTKELEQICSDWVSAYGRLTLSEILEVFNVWTTEEILDDFFDSYPVPYDIRVSREEVSEVIESLRTRSPEYWTEKYNPSGEVE